MVTNAQERQAAEWLKEEGYEVHWFIDKPSFLIRKDNKITEVKVCEVKLRGPKYNPDFVFTWSLYLTPDEIRLGVKPLFVFENQIGWNRDYFVNVKQEKQD